MTCKLASMLRGLLLATFFLLAVSPVAVAQSIWSYQPSPLEWANWPEYCRIQWTQWSGGRDPEGKQAYSESIRSGLKAALGEETYTPLHHWCAGIHYLAKSRALTDRESKQHWLGRAAYETEFTYDRVSQSSPVYPNISVTLARARVDQRRVDDAIAILERSIAAHPSRMEHYIAMVDILKSSGQKEAARNVVVRAQNSLPKDSAEVQYNLGLLSLEIGDISSAVKSAQFAYSKAYPLQGLKRKLVKLGKWQEPVL